MRAAEPGGPLAPGAKIDRYELAAFLGEDDSGAAWLAREASAAGATRLVRLRFPSPALAADDRFRVLLRQEVKVAAGVAHPNVAQVLGLHESDDGAERSGGTLGPAGHVFVVSEWVEGETLADIRAAAAANAAAKRKAIPPAIVLRILADACAGLHAAHLLRDQGTGDRGGNLLNVVHGDVSAASLVVGTDGGTRVVDLGFTKARARHAGGANASWMEAGKPSQRVDRHADVWGIGAILAQAFDDDLERGLGPPVLPALLSELVRRARSTDPLERFATAAEMQGAIEAATLRLGIPATRGTVAAFTKGLVGERTAARARALALRGSVPKTPAVLTIPTPAVDSVPATVQSLRPPAAPPEPIVASTLPAAVTTTTISRSVIRAKPVPRNLTAPGHGRAGLFAAGFVVAVLGAGTSGYLAMRAHAPAARTMELAPLAAASSPAALLKPSCPPGTTRIENGAAPFCLDAAPVTTEAYKACSDAGDCKRAATENRWPGISPRDQAAYDPLCHERDPKAHAQEPANCVDRAMATVYCEAHGAHLPTEAEAALAPARGGGGFDEWGSPPCDPATKASLAAATRSYALGFRCARSLPMP